MQNAFSRIITLPSCCPGWTAYQAFSGLPGSCGFPGSILVLAKKNLYETTTLLKASPHLKKILALGWVRSPPFHQPQPAAYSAREDSLGRSLHLAATLLTKEGNRYHRCPYRAIPYWMKCRIGIADTVRLRGIGTGISEASKRVPILPFATQRGKQESSYFRQGN